MRLDQRSRREQGRHTDDWLITYADTITLLLCLFVVILSIRTADKHLPPASAPPVSLASEDIFAGRPPFGGLTAVMDRATDDFPPQSIGDSGEAVQKAPWPVFRADAEAPAKTPGDVAAPGPIPSRPMDFIASTATPPGSTRETAGSEIASAASPAIADHLKSTDTVLVEQHGDRITTLQISSAAFFGSGYATLSGTGKSILRDVAVTLKSAEFASYHISIEGHTDDMPISTTQFQSNWELSTARAAAVVRFLLEEGIPARKLTAAGYADTFPIRPNRTAAGIIIPENQALNRRVVIKLEKIDKAER